MSYDGRCLTIIEIKPTIGDQNTRGKEIQGERKYKGKDDIGITKS